MSADGSTGDSASESGALTAIVLSAGVSRRMGRPTIPKSMMPLTDDEGGVTFLERHVATLRQLGIAQVHVVVAESSRDMCPRLEGMNVVVNGFDTSATGSTLSLLCALRSADIAPNHGVLVTDADIVYERALMRWVIDHCDTSCIFISPNHAGDDEEVTVYGPSASSPRLIGKGLSNEMTAGLNLLGESLGIIYIAPGDRQLLRDTVEWLAGWPPHRGYGFSKEMSEHEEIWQYGFTTRWMSAAVVPGDLLCSECDTPDDYRFVREELFPRILARDAESAPVVGVKSKNR